MVDAVPRRRVSLDVRNLDAALSFYVNRLGLSEASRQQVPGGVTVVCGSSSGGASVELRHEPERPDRSISDYHVQFTVPDTRQAVEELSADGVFVLQEPFTRDDRLVAFVLDPDGHLVELSSGS